MTQKQKRTYTVHLYVVQLQLGHLADAFIQSDLHRLIHTLTHQPRQPARQEQLG